MGIYPTYYDYRDKNATPTPDPTPMTTPTLTDTLPRSSIAAREARYTRMGVTAGSAGRLRAARMLREARKTVWAR